MDHNNFTITFSRKIFLNLMLFTLISNSLFASEESFSNHTPINPEKGALIDPIPDEILGSTIENKQNNLKIALVCLNKTSSTCEGYRYVEYKTLDSKWRILGQSNFHFQPYLMTFETKKPLGWMWNIKNDDQWLTKNIANDEEFLPVASATLICGIGEAIWGGAAAADAIHAVVFTVVDGLHALFVYPFELLANQIRENKIKKDNKLLTDMVLDEAHDGRSSSIRLSAKRYQRILNQIELK